MFQFSQEMYTFCLFHAYSNEINLLHRQNCFQVYVLKFRQQKHVVIFIIEHHGFKITPLTFGLPPTHPIATFLLFLCISYRHEECLGASVSDTDIRWQSSGIWWVWFWPAASEIDTTWCESYRRGRFLCMLVSDAEITGKAAVFDKLGLRIGW